METDQRPESGCLGTVAHRQCIEDGPQHFNVDAPVARSGRCLSIMQQSSLGPIRFDPPPS